MSHQSFYCWLVSVLQINVSKSLSVILGRKRVSHHFFSKLGFVKTFGRQSELRKSERRKPKRTPKTMLTITTSKRIIKAIRTSKSKFSERRKANYHNVEKKRMSKVIICLKTTFDVVIILNAIGKIRMSKVLGKFST